jgi:hypothetical protein
MEIGHKTLNQRMVTLERSARRDVHSELGKLQDELLWNAAKPF